MTKIKRTLIQMATLLTLISSSAFYGESALLPNSSASPIANNSAAQADTTRPVCLFSAFRAGPPIAVDITAQDTGSGISTITVSAPLNFSVSVGAFTPGTTSPVTITATKNDNTKVSSFELRITDVAGNVTVCEIDQFPNSRARVAISNVNGLVDLTGPVTVIVDIGALRDVSNRCPPLGSALAPNGLEEVPSEIVQMDLTGTAMGMPVSVRLRSFTKHPFMRSTGEIEETANTQAGRLDVPPFAPSGTACSFFDVFFEVQINNGPVQHTDTPKRMRTTISNKPPLEIDIYTSPDPPIPLFFEDHSPSGITIGAASHAPCGAGSPPTSGVTRTGTDAQGRKFVEITVQDTASGLAVINILASENSNVDVPAFTPGTRDPVKIVATKINQSLSSNVVVQSIDVCGNINDPAVIEIVREAGKPEAQVLVQIPTAENRIDVINGAPGLTNLTIDVNGTKYQVAGLRDNERRVLDVTSAMRQGDNNTVIVTGRGKPGGTAMIIISENK